MDRVDPKRLAWHFPPRGLFEMALLKRPHKQLNDNELTPLLGLVAVLF